MSGEPMATTPLDAAERDAATATVYESCLALNANRWDDFLSLCDPQTFCYRITNYSPEIKREQCWMDQDFAKLTKLFQLLPRHNSDRAHLARHATVYRVARGADCTVDATTAVAVYRTEWDAGDSHLLSGATSLYVVGRYVDRLRVQGGVALLLRRTMELDTRQVGIGSHHIL
jgi:hypothetical protein